jgi:predicted DNA-binding protein with PD1-like motif
MRLRLEAGHDLNAAIARAFAAEGLDGGYVDLAGAALAPIAFVIPAAAPDRSHAAWYSQSFTSPEAVIETAGATVGRRDGACFIHCHGLWRLQDGTLHMGHLLPDESPLAEDCTVAAIGITGATFEARQDEETNFRLFAASSTEAAATGDALLLTLKPNQDVCAAIESTCRVHDIANASIFGIGSLVGTTFEDATPALSSIATEVLVEEGRLENGLCRLTAASVGMDGSFARGPLAAGANAVCVTFELVILSD